MTHNDLIQSMYLPAAQQSTGAHDLARVLAAVLLFLVVGVAASFAPEIPADRSVPEWHGNVAASGPGG
jgi:hypothetical protein